MNAAAELATAPIDPHAAAVQLLALTALANEVADRIADLKSGAVAAWEAGSKQTINLPGARPNTFRKVGEVRQDGGHTVAEVVDDAAWFSWASKHTPHNILSTRGGRDHWELDDPSRTAVQQGIEAALAESEAFDRDEPAAFLEALEAHGYTLAPVVVREPQHIVAESWTQAVLKASHDAKTPVTPDGEIPDGIAVSVAPPRPVVVLTAKKDPGLVAEWIDTVRTEVPAIAGIITPTEETQA